MKTRLLTLSLAFLAICSIPAYSQMSDNAIIAYISEGMATGKSETQLAGELLSKGVSTSQVKRLMNKYKSSGADIPGVQTGVNSLAPARDNTRKSASRNYAKDNLKDDVRDNLKDKVIEEDEEITAGQERKDTVLVNPLLNPDGTKRIYGHDVFNNKRLSFEPNENGATPADYVIGPGDELMIDVWGENEATITQTVSPDGYIFISQVGRLQLGGLTIARATSKVKTSLARKYSGVSSGRSQVSVTLSGIRTILVNVMGEAAVPGTYRLSSFSNVFNALYRAGGVTSVGSLRAVRVMRGGEKVADADIYEYIFKGSAASNVPLKDGDVIIVPAYSTLVSVEGGIKRPMYYEMKAGETLSDLLEYAGGFTGDAHVGEMNVERCNSANIRVFTVDSGRFGSFALEDGDSVDVPVNKAGTYANMVEVRGSVYRPGQFEYGGSIATVKQLVDHAGGLLDDAFTARAQIIREKPDRTLELVSVSLKGIIDGTVPDVALRKNDVLVVASNKELEDKGDLTISGYVVNPGHYQYAENMSVEDLILLAGGLAEGASSVRVDVSRRVNDPSSTNASDTLAKVFTFGIKDGLASDGTPDFELQPFDLVAVRRSPTYVEQKVVTISGEVTFPGQYTLVSNTERISDLLKRAGGPTPHGNVKGGMLKRKVNQYERNVHSEMARIAKLQSSLDKGVHNMDKAAMKLQDSLTTSRLKLPEIYTVGVEMDKALANPGSDYDVVLRDGDEIIVPEILRTVRIQGEVLHPNTVHFISGKRVGYYVRQAGGYSQKAKRSKTYMLNMNGTVSVGRGAKLQPGCEIVVPQRPEKQKLTTGEWIGIGTSAASVATMIATIVNLFK